MNFIRRKSSGPLLTATLASVLLLNVHPASAQNNSPPPATATRPAKVLPEQTSAPNSSPPASRTRTTGEASQDPTIQKMNEDAMQKIKREGK